MAVSEAKRKANAKWDKANMQILACKAKKSGAKALQEAASEKGESISGYIKNAVQSRYKADTGKDIEL